METKPEMLSAQFTLGDLVHHKLFDYRGVVVDVDPRFQLTEEWYERVARTRPPREQPWYHVLVHESNHSTYVAERNLEPDRSGEEINNPMIEQFFTHLANGRYVHDLQVH